MAVDSDLKKILLMGLDNSGKTSILISLKQDSNLLSYLHLKPTRGLHIESLDSSQFELNIWDFGGQEQYREEYMNNFYKYTDAASKLIYVIDIQDQKRYDKALSYLQNVLSLLEREKKIIAITIFLHKYDPNIKKQENFEKIDEIVKIELIDKISEFIPENFKYEIYKTCIYSIFEKDLVKKSI